MHVFQTVTLVYVYCYHLVILCVTTKECITEWLELQFQFIVNGEYGQYFFNEETETSGLP
jgi:hypothetical protein